MRCKALRTVPAILCVAALVVACSEDGTVDVTAPDTPGIGTMTGAKKPVGDKPGGGKATIWEVFVESAFTGMGQLKGTFNDRMIMVDGAFTLRLDFTQDWHEIVGGGACDISGANENYLLTVLDNNPVRWLPTGSLTVNVDKGLLEGSGGDYGVVVNYTVDIDGAEYFLTTGGGSNEIIEWGESSRMVSKQGGFIRINKSAEGRGKNKTPGGTIICRGIVDYTINVTS